MTSRGNIIRRPEKWRENEPISARKLEELRDGLDRLIEGTITSQVRGEQRLFRQVFQAQITGVWADYLDVVEYREYVTEPPFIGSQPILIAKPWLLRRTPFDGGSWNGISYSYTSDQTRLATQGPDSEIQHVTPSYVVGDIIYCAGQLYGGSSVIVSQQLLTALDMNVDGRAWAADPPPAP